MTVVPFDLVVDYVPRVLCKVDAVTRCRSSSTPACPAA